MKILLAIVFALLIGALVAIGSASQTTPTEVVKDQLKSFENGDYEKSCSYFAPAAANALESPCEERLKEGANQYTKTYGENWQDKIQYDDFEEQTQGNQATVKFTKKIGKKKTTITVGLTKIDDEWKLG